MVRDAGNSFAEARRIRLRNGTLKLNDSLGQDDDLDFYQFRFNNRSSFNCSLNRLRGNVELTLFDRDGKAIAVSNEQDGDPEIIRRRLDAGKYFLRVRHISGEVRYNLRSAVFEQAGRKFAEALQIRPDRGDQLKGRFIFQDALVSSSRERRFAFYQFSLAERSTFTTLLEGLRADADLELFNSSRQRISFSASSVTSESITEVLEAGVYFIRVKVKEGRTQYRLKCSFDSEFIDLGGNAIDRANLIDLGGGTFVATDFVGATDPDDYYRVDLASPNQLSLALNGLSADANLQLLGSDGTLLGSSTNPGTAQDLLDRNLAAGTYFVRILPAVGGTSTRYTLTFNLSPLQLFGLTETNSLVAFDADTAGQAVNIGVTGLAAGETLRSIDFRPATGELFGLSSASKLYTISLATGAATPVSPTPLTPAPAGAAAGFDFNPTVDRIRLVTELDENVRLNPLTGAIAATDTALAYDSSDANAAANPNVTASAYTENFLGALSTTLYGIDTNSDTLVRQGSLNGVSVSPNAGTLFTVGSLGADFGAAAAFDIFTDLGLVNTAYAASGSTLYGINLSTGAATSLGTVGVDAAPVNLIGLAARP